MLFSDVLDGAQLKRLFPDLVVYSQFQFDALLRRLKSASGRCLVLLDARVSSAEHVAIEAFRGQHSLAVLSDAPNSQATQELKRFGALVLPLELEPVHIEVLRHIKGLLETSGETASAAQAEKTSTLLSVQLPASGDWSAPLRSIASATEASRVGVVSLRKDKYEETGHFRYHSSGWSCDAKDPLVRCLEDLATPVFRSSLDAVPTAGARADLEAFFTQTSSELLVPAFSGGRLSGWLFFGRRIDGSAWVPAQAHELMNIGDLLGQALQNFAQQAEGQRWEAFGRKLAGLLPARLFLVAEDGRIVWHNDHDHLLLASDAPVECRSLPLDLSGMFFEAVRTCQPLRSTVVQRDQMWVVDIHPKFVENLSLLKLEISGEVFNEHIILNALTSVRTCVELLEGHEDLKKAAQKDIQALERFAKSLSARASLMATQPIA